jgi:menaquinone-dependent protoporphyrinogen oxidase
MSSTRTTLITCDVPVFYATSEGQTRKIAERLAIVLAARGLDSRALDLASADANAVNWPHVRGALVGASIHAGGYQHEARTFLRAHAEFLNRIPSAFFSVSLSAASEHATERDVVRRLAESFPAANGWTPSVVVSFAGRLAYTQYGFLKRLIMKRIARKEGGPTDTSRDYELTNWTQVERLADDVAARVREAPPAPAAWRPGPGPAVFRLA